MVAVGDKEIAFLLRMKNLIFAGALFGKVPNINCVRQVSWLVTV